MPNASPGSLVRVAVRSRTSGSRNANPKATIPTGTAERNTTWMAVAYAPVNHS